MLAKVEIPYRVIDVAAGDLGLQRGPQVRLRGVGADAEHLPRGHLDLQLHRLPGAAPGGAAPRRRRRDPAGRDPQRHAGDHPLDRRDPGEPPAGRRLGPRAEGAAAVPRPRPGAVKRDDVANVEPEPDEPSARGWSPPTSTGRSSRSRRHDLATAPSPPSPGSSGPGPMLVMVTGRPPRWMRYVADAVGHRGVAICANGASSTTCTPRPSCGPTAIAARGAAPRSIDAAARRSRRAARSPWSTTDGFVYEPTLPPRRWDATDPAAGRRRPTLSSPAAAASCSHSHPAPTPTRCSQRRPRPCGDLVDRHPLVGRGAARDERARA